MKKVLTILAIMIVAACAVFADTAPNAGTSETHKLTVQTTVDLVLPCFSFSATNNNVTVATNTAATPGKFDSSDANPDFKNDTALVLANTNISNAAITQKFDIISLAVANYNGSFDLTVAATAFKGKDAKNVEYTTKGTITYAYAKLTPAETNHITTVCEENGQKITVTYAGKQVETNVGLGNVTITWPQDTAAIPATYTADVTLTVAAL